MAVNENLITTTELTDAKLREIDFVNRFSENITKLVEALGITRKIAKQAGTTLKSYKAQGTLQSGKVAEGETIPLSKYKIVPKTYKDIELNKWAKATTIEAVQKYGFEQAVTKTSDQMLLDAQKGIRKNFFDFLGEETGKSTVTGVGMQQALARGWGKLKVLFEDDVVDTVYFVNPEDVAEYLGSASITTQNVFGMTYIENFLGLGTVFTNSSVPKGKYYATAKDNVVLYYIPVNGADIDNVFKFTADETGYIGIHESSDYTNLTCLDTVVSGIEIFAERTDGVVVGSITAPTATQSADSKAVAG
uniref:Major capsid protein n=1 Tax=Siphoviridae sp. ctljn1 TaxID=2826448 RepID=A0A8S5R1V4_9CAUD|nr:MAG TPA: major capsid protein [Siphoviridae sp. ctljn1]